MCSLKYMYVKKKDFNIDNYNQSNAVVIKKLCESSDSCDDRIFDRAELIV